MWINSQCVFTEEAAKRQTRSRPNRLSRVSVRSLGVPLDTDVSAEDYAQSDDDDATPTIEHESPSPAG